MPQEKTDTLKDSISNKEVLIEKTEEELRELKDEVSQLEKDSSQFFNKKKEILSRKDEVSRKKEKLETQIYSVARKEAEIKAEERIIEERERKEEDPLKKKEIEKKRWRVEDERRVVEDERWELDKKLEEVENQIRIVEKEVKSEESLNRESELRKKQLYHLIDRKEEDLNYLKEEVAQLKEKKEEIVSRKEELKQAEEERRREARYKSHKIENLYSEAVFDYEAALYDSAEEKFKEMLTLCGPYERVSFFKSIFKEKPLPQKANDYLRKISRIKLERRRELEKEDLQRRKDEEMFPQTKVLYIRISEIKAKRRDVEEKIKRVLLNRSLLLEKEKEELEEEERLKGKIASLSEKETQLEESKEGKTENEIDMLEGEKEEVKREREVLEEEVRRVKEDLEKNSREFEEVEEERSSLERKLGELTVDIEENKEKVEQIKKEYKKEPEEAKDLKGELQKEITTLYNEAFSHYKIGELDIAEQKFREVIRLYGPFDEVKFPLSLIKDKPLPQKAEEYLKDLLKLKKEKEKKEKKKEEKEEAYKRLYEKAEEAYKKGDLQGALKQMRSLQNKEGVTSALAAEYVKKIEEELKQTEEEKPKEEVQPTEEETEKEAYKDLYEEAEQSYKEGNLEAALQEFKRVEKEAEGEVSALAADYINRIEEELKQREAEQSQREEEQPEEEVQTEQPEETQREEEKPKEEAQPTEEEIEREAYKDLYEEAERNYNEDDLDTAVEQFRSVKENAKGEVSALAADYIKKIEEQLKEKELKRLYEEAEETYKEGDLQGALQQFYEVEKEAEGEVSDLSTDYINRIEEELKQREAEQSQREAEQSQREAEQSQREEEQPEEAQTKETEQPEEVAPRGEKKEQETREKNYKDLYEEAEQSYKEGNLEAALQQFKTVEKEAEEELSSLAGDYIKKIEEKEDDDGETDENKINSLYENAVADYEAGNLDSAEEKFSEVIRLYGDFKDIGFLKSLLKRKSVAQQAEEYLDQINALKKKEREEERLIVEEIRRKAITREDYHTEEGKRKKTLKELFEQAEMNYKQGKLNTALQQFRYLEKEEDEISTLASEYIKKIEDRKAKEEEWSKEGGEEVIGRKQKKIEKKKQKEEEKEAEDEMIEYKRRLVMENFKEDYDDEVVPEEEVEDQTGEEKEKKETETDGTLLRVKRYLQGSRFFRAAFTLTRRYTTVAMDISDFSIEVLHLNKQRVILAYARSLVDKGVIEKGEVVDEERLKEAIKYTLKITQPVSLEVSKRSRMKAVVTLPESKIFVRQFKFEKEKSVMEEIKNQMKLTIPIPIEDLYFDHHFVSSANVSEVSVLCVAVEKKLVDSYVEILKSIGVDPIAFDIESAALGRALITERDEEEKERNEMIIDFGATKSVLSVFQKGVLAFSVSLKVGGSYLTEKIAEKEGVSFKDAERKKKYMGVSGEIESVLSQELDRVVMEIKEAEMYYEREFNKKVDSITLAGGSSLLPGLISYLEEGMNRRIIVGDPLKKVKGGKALRGKEAILFANVIGLALRSTETDPVRGSLNLLPESIKTREFRMQQEEKRPVVIIAVLISVIGLIALVISAYFFYTH